MPVGEETRGSVDFSGIIRGADRYRTPDPGQGQPRDGGTYQRVLPGMMALTREEVEKEIYILDFMII